MHAQNSDLLEAGLRRASQVAQTLERQRKDLLQTAPQHQEGADLLGRAARAAELVVSALENTISRHLNSGKRP